MRPELEQLARLVAPPESLRSLDYAPEWDDIEGRLGLRLPSDYKELAETYGPGEFCDQVVLFVPWEANSPNPTHREDFVEIMRLAADNLHRLRRDTGLFAGMPLWPEPGGLMQLGGISTGSDLFWLTDKQDPDEWTCAEMSEQSELQLHDCNLTLLLVRWLSGELTTDFLSPSEYGLPSGPYFESNAGKVGVKAGFRGTFSDRQLALETLARALPAPWVLWSEFSSDFEAQQRIYVPEFDWSLSVVVTLTGLGVRGLAASGSHSEFAAMARRLAEYLNVGPDAVNIEIPDGGE